VVGEESVGEEVCCRVGDDLRYGAGPEVAVCRYRVVEAQAAEGDHDCKVVAVWPEGHGYELLELGYVEGYGVAAEVDLVHRNEE
jgi:hypothetical protein